MNDDTDSSGSANAEGDAGGGVELNEKQLGKALAKALDGFFASLELLSGTSLEFEGQEAQQNQAIDEVTSWLFGEGDDDDQDEQNQDIDEIMSCLYGEGNEDDTEQRK